MDQPPLATNSLLPVSKMLESPKVTPQEAPTVTPQETPKETPQERPNVTPHSLVSEDLVRDALKADKGSDAEILSYEVKDFTNKGDNYLSATTSVSVLYRQGNMEGKVTYVAKCNPCRIAPAFNELSYMLFEKEANFYNKFVPMFNAELKAAGQEPLRFADCYVSQLRNKEEVILLRDLRQDGFRMFDRKKGMDVAHAKLVLRELARLHAASTLVQAKMTEPMEEKYSFLKKDYGWVPEDSGGETHSKDLFENIFYGNMKTAAAMAEKVGGYEKVVDWLRRHVRQGPDFFFGSFEKTPPFDVVCHGDFWNNNLLFKYDDNGKPVDARILDLQLCRKASPAIDLNYFLYTSFNGSDRKNNLEAFLKIYYDAFTEVFFQAGKKTPFTLEELKKEYHDKNLFGLMSCLFVVPLVVAGATDVPDFDGMSGDLESDMKEFEQQIIGSLDTNPYLRPRLLATFDDMVEYGVIS